MGLTCILAATVTCALAKDQSIRGPIPNDWREMRPVALVVPDFAAPDPQLRQTAADMARLIGSVLQRSCHYKLINNGDRLWGLRAILINRP
jgi:hypothetical protein